MALYQRLLVGTVLLAAFAGRADLVRAKPSAPASKDLIQLAVPVLYKHQHEFTIPSAFWNEHLTDWLDVALCGRPSNFLHETVLSIQTTRHILKQAFTAIGYHSATRWSPDLREFGAIRGQPVLILAHFNVHGKPQTFLLDELIEFRAWHVSIGPFGWLYLGTIDPYHTANPGLYPRAGQYVDPADILADDPQAAMQFRGILHASQALLDFPLCFDNWIYPNIRYHRNSAVLAMKVFNSNGKVPVQLIFRRVSETQYLRAAAKYWHNPRFLPYLAKQMPVAKAIDFARRQLWNLVAHRHLPWSNWRVERCVAQLQYGYARLQVAWVAWDVAHARFRPANNLSKTQVANQAKLFLSHLRQVAARDHQLWLATVAFDKLHILKKASKPTAPEVLRRLQSEELSARCQARLDSNAQNLQFWGKKKRRLNPNDPRKIWIRDVNAQYALAEAQNALGYAGLAYAAAMKSGPVAAAQRRYLAAILQVSWAKENVALVNVDFHITNDQGFVSAGHLAALKAQRAAIVARIKRINAQLKTVSAP
ncbi:MAG: hypothetical protein ACP5I8_00505 [Phycisphaerae bacterium]